VPSSRMPREEREALFRNAFFALTGEQADILHYPGGSSRKTCLVTSNRQVYALSRRASSGRARLEYEVLSCLRAAAPLVPEPLAWRDRWVLTRYVQAVRLPEAYQSARDTAERNSLALRTLKALRTIQVEGDRGLGHLPLPKIGASADWIRKFVSLPFKLAEHYQVGSPNLNQDRAVAVLIDVEYRFVKWDSRPGNALVTADGEPVWIDFEYCGLRNPLDDLAWFIADEWQAGDPEVLWQEAIAPLETGHENSSSVRHPQYLALYCLLHICVRLSLVLDRIQKGDRCNADRQRTFDLIGTNKACIEALTRSAAFFAEHCTCWPNAETTISSLAEIALQLLAQRESGAT